LFGTADSFFREPGFPRDQVSTKPGQLQSARRCAGRVAKSI
jgi:hypothetical protein